MYHADLLGGVAARLAGNNVIWGFEDLPFLKVGYQQLEYRNLLFLGILFLPRVIVCCAESARMAHVKKGYDHSKMIVIPNGYELSHFNKDPVFRQKARTLLGLMITR